MHIGSGSPSRQRQCLGVIIIVWKEDCQNCPVLYCVPQRVLISIGIANVSSSYK